MNEHLELSTYIKSVHKKLRQDAKSMGHEKAWQIHTADRATLSKYASAMKNLACDHWSKNELKENSKVTSRNKWIHRNCLEYFQNGLLYQRQREIDIASRNELDGEIFKDLGKPDSSEKLSVLDVGSCYNPLRIYGEFDVLPIDISPASDEVYQCDFLNLRIGNKEIIKELDSKIDDEEIINELDLKIDEEEIINELDLKIGDQKIIYELDLKTDEEDSLNEKSTKQFKNSDSQINNKSIKQLQKATFHVISFCLFLEYLPDASQRLGCCEKAYELLKPEGLLVILTPDSKHVGKNAAFMKSWRFALAKIGFSRIKYEKLPYLHCMLFRKSVNPRVAKRWVEIERNKPAYDGIYIPQDFNCENFESENKKNSEFSCNDKDNIQKNSDFSCTDNDNIQVQKYLVCFYFVHVYFYSIR